MSSSAKAKGLSADTIIIHEVPNYTWHCVLKKGFRRTLPRNQKSVNLKYITVGQLDDDMIVPPSDGAMFILID